MEERKENERGLSNIECRQKVKREKDENGADKSEANSEEKREQ